MSLVVELRTYLLEHFEPPLGPAQVVTQGLGENAIAGGLLPLVVEVRPLGGPGADDGDLVFKRVQVYVYGERYADVRAAYEQVKTLLDAYPGYPCWHTESNDLSHPFGSGIEKPGHGADFYFHVDRSVAA